MMAKQKYVLSEANGSRAAWAQRAIQAFESETSCDREDSLCDLLCDLMHFAAQGQFDFDRELSRAQGHFDVEKTGEEI